MTTATLAEFEAQITKYIEVCVDEPVIVTQNGKPFAVLLSSEDSEELERLAMAYSPQLNAILDEARRQIRAGDYLEHDEFWRSLEEEDVVVEHLDTASRKE